MNDPMTVVTVLGLVSLSFVATNIDNLALLVGWLVSKQVKASRIFAGYMTGMFILLLLSIIISFVSFALPLSYLGFFGVIPLLLGFIMLLRLVRGGEESDGQAGVKGAFVAIAMTQVANGVDTLLVFAPLLVDSRTEVDYIIALVFMVVAVLWFWFAQFLSYHASRLEVITRVGRWIAPVVMIAVGLYILDNTVTDMIAGDS
jgi:cadmium resistance protein CadD (predicted permease)